MDSSFESHTLTVEIRMKKVFFHSFAGGESNRSQAIAGELIEFELIGRQIGGKERNENQSKTHKLFSLSLSLFQQKLPLESYRETDDSPGCTGRAIRVASG